MSDAAAALNRTLAREAPALARALSERGRALAFPEGIPFQAAQARSAEINGTIGQLTDGNGGALPLAPVQPLLAGLDPALAWLYAPIQGPDGLRTRWLARQRALAGDPPTPTGMPFVTHGLAHAVSLLTSLIADPDLDVVLPQPAWENYDLVIELAGGGRVLGYDFFDDSGAFNLDGLAARLAEVRSKALVVLNFPNNPTGYVPTTAEMAAIAALLAAQPGPIVVAVDDAYQGWVYDSSRESRSIFWELARVADPERMQVFKVDGATKELVFFSSRVGFLTGTLTADAGAALESKLKCHVRGTVGCASGPAMAVIDAALQHPQLEQAFEARRQLMAGRASILRDALDKLDSPRLLPRPFHGAFFAVVQVDGDAEALRRKLLAEYSTGVVAFAEAKSIRLAYCSLADAAIPELVDRLGRAARD